MKGIDLFCASPASTAICSASAVDQRSIVRHGSGRAIDRHNPHLRDTRRAKAISPFSQPPTKPKSYHPKSRKSSAKQTDIQSPPGSSRYLLSDTSFFDVFSDFDKVSAIIPGEPARSRSLKADESAVIRPPSSSSTRSHDQVVVLRVSLHCKGCEGKVKKHISRMEGVTSYNIDFATKKVTVIGDVTPLGVLASISRVKNAQLWPSSP